ncbi:MAG: septal ring lytic transglycosylase RlpA family protein [bacterium]
MILVSACSVVPRYAGKYKGQKLNNPEESINNYSELSESYETISGLASYYAEKFNGRTTSSGEIYDMYGLTAAHPTMPFGTILRITNLKNFRTVIVRINDRMPEHPERIIDISYGAASELDMLRDGVITVQIDVLEWGPEINN